MIDTVSHQEGGDMHTYDSAGENPTIADQLSTRAEACATYEEFRTRLEDDGIWVNDSAARTVFDSMHCTDELDLDDLDTVVGGYTAAPEFVTLTCDYCGSIVVPKPLSNPNGATCPKCGRPGSIVTMSPGSE